MFLCNIIVAHPGKTDSNGGHYDRSTGEYHYHHGYSAHQHIDGICPYEYNDNTNDTNSSNIDEVKEVIKNNVNNNDKEVTSPDNKISIENSSVLSNNDCIFLTTLTCIVSILIGSLLCFVYKYQNKTIKYIVGAISFFIIWILILELFYVPSQMYNAFKDNNLQDLLVPCISTILLIPVLYSVYFINKD